MVYCDLWVLDWAQPVDTFDIIFTLTIHLYFPPSGTTLLQVKVKYWYNCCCQCCCCWVTYLGGWVVGGTILNSSQSYNWHHAFLLHVVCNLSKYSILFSLSVKCPSPMRNRDFVTQRSWYWEEDNFIIFNHTVHHKVRVVGVLQILEYSRILQLTIHIFSARGKILEYSYFWEVKQISELFLII